MASRLTKYAIMGMSLQAIMAGSEFVESVVTSFPVYIQRCLMTTNIKTVQDALCVCVCVCVYICMCECMYICVCMYVCTYVCMYVRTYVCMYVRTYVCMYVCK